MLPEGITIRDFHEYECVRCYTHFAILVNPNLGDSEEQVQTQRKEIEGRLDEECEAGHLLKFVRVCDFV